MQRHQLEFKRAPALLKAGLSALSMVFSRADILVLLFGVVLGGVRHTLKVLEQCWRLIPGFALLYWKKLLF